MLRASCRPHTPAWWVAGRATACSMSIRPQAIPPWRPCGLN